jgi:hypothetical protein
MTEDFRFHYFQPLTSPASLNCLCSCAHSHSRSAFMREPSTYTVRLSASGEDKRKLLFLTFGSDGCSSSTAAHCAPGDPIHALCNRLDPDTFPTKHNLMLSNSSNHQAMDEQIATQVAHLLKSSNLTMAPTHPARDCAGCCGV